MTDHCSPRQLLQSARNLLHDEIKWIAGSWAEDEHADEVFPWEPDAETFCAVGAIAKVANDCELFDGRDTDGEAFLRSMTDPLYWPPALRQAVEELALSKRHADPGAFDQDAWLAHHTVEDAIEIITEWNDRAASHDSLMDVFAIAIGRAAEHEVVK